MNVGFWGWKRSVAMNAAVSKKYLQAGSSDVEGQLEPVLIVSGFCFKWHWKHDVAKKKKKRERLWS